MVISDYNTIETKIHYKKDRNGLLSDNYISDENDIIRKKYFGGNN